MTKTDMRLALKAYNNSGCACTKKYIYTVDNFQDTITNKIMLHIQKMETCCDNDHAISQKFISEVKISLDRVIQLAG